MKAARVCAVVALGALSTSGCTPDWAKGSGDVVMLMTAINGGTPLESDVAISTGEACADSVALRLENHFKNPAIASSGFHNDYTVERYEVHYVRSDGRNTEGVDVPYSITGNLAQEVINSSDATLSLEVVRRQAKLEAPLFQLKKNPTDPDAANGETAGAVALTVFADVTLHARTTTGVVLNPVTGRLQIDFANFGDALKACPKL